MLAAIKCEAEDSFSMVGTLSSRPRCHDDAGEPDNGSGIDETCKSERVSCRDHSLDEKEKSVEPTRSLPSVGVTQEPHAWMMIAFLWMLIVYPMKLWSRAEFPKHPCGEVLLTFFLFLRREGGRRNTV